MMYSPNGQPAALAHVSGEDHNGPSGTVAFYPRRNGVLVEANIRGLPHEDGPCASRVFGFHIHEGDFCAGEGFSETQGHLALENCDHPHHTGDLPPLFGCGGQAYLAVLTDRFRIRDIIGRTVVIHELPDDLKTRPSGSSGSKIACGAIRPVR